MLVPKQLSAVQNPAIVRKEMCKKGNNDCRLRLDTRAPFLVPLLSLCTARDTCFPPQDAAIRHLKPVVPDGKGCGSRLRRQHESRELIPSPRYGWSPAWRRALISLILIRRYKAGVSFEFATQAAPHPYCARLFVLVPKLHESLFSQKNTIKVTVSMPEWLWM